MAIDIHSKLVAVVSAVLGTAVVAVAASTLIPNKVIRGEFFNFGVKISKEANEKKTNEANDSKKADEEKKPAASAPKKDEFVELTESQIFVDKKAGTLQPGITSRTENGEVHYFQGNKRVVIKA